jgi:hypothetical protein
MTKTPLIGGGQKELTNAELFTGSSPVHNRSMLAVNIFYRRFQLENVCEKKSAGQTKKPSVKINFYWRFF